MRLLITGGCGFLGSNLAADSLSRSDDLCIFDNLSRVGSYENLDWLRRQGHFSFVHGDIRNSHDVVQVISGFKPEAIFHLAGQVAMTTSIANPRHDFEVNALGTINLLEAVRLHAPEAAVVYSSTNKVYGDLEQYTYKETETRYECLEYPDGFDESTPLDFHSPYGCSKGAADQYMLDYARIFGLKTVVFRHSSMYGGRQFATFDQGWVGWFCQQALAIKTRGIRDGLTIFGSGKQVRDLLHIDDAKRLYAAALAQIDISRGQPLNIGGGRENSLSLTELFALLEELLDIRISYERTPPRASDQRVFVSNLRKTKNLLRVTPAISVRDGVGKMLEWLKDI